MYSPRVFLVFVLLGIPNFSIGALAQKGQPQPARATTGQVATSTRPIWNTTSIPQQKTASGPAPRRDISGIWDSFGAVGGNGGGGLRPASPFTAWGTQKASEYKPGDGPRMVPVGLINDPLDSCDPAGFPRDLFFELRAFHAVQTPEQVLIMYEYQRVWRAIWTDGRELPKDPEPRWYGYSVGKWEGDYTFVVQTTGVDERTWLDNAGNPHSADMHVEERYHRVDHDTLELTVKIDDPKAYTAPWLGRDRLILKLQPKNFDIREMICAATEAEEYKKVFANPATVGLEGR